MSGRRWVARWSLLLLLVGILGAGVVLWQQGYRVYVVHTGSMIPTYEPGDIVIDGPPSGHYAKGEVLTFLHSDTATDVVTHRVTGVSATGLIHTKGDANRTADVWEIRPDQVQGRTVYSVRGLGYLMVFLRQPTGTAALATSVLSIALLWTLFFPSAPTAASTKPDDPETAVVPDGVCPCVAGPDCARRQQRRPLPHVSYHLDRCSLTLV